MIDISLDEKCIFTFNSEEKSIIIYRHQDGKLEGSVEGPLGAIKFSDKWQVDHLIEILTLLSNKITN